MEATVTFAAPPGLDDAEASGFVIAYQTGWFALHGRAGSSPARPCSSTRRPAGWAAPPCSWARPRAPGSWRSSAARRRPRWRGGGRRHRARPAYRGLRRRGQGGDRRTRGGRGVRPRRRRRVCRVDQVRRLRGPHRRWWASPRRRAGASARPRAGEELRDPRPPLGPTTRRSTRLGCGAPTTRCPSCGREGHRTRWSVSGCGSTGSRRACSGSPTASRSEGSCGRRDRRPAGPRPRRPAPVARQGRAVAPGRRAHRGAHRGRQVQPHLPGVRRHHVGRRPPPSARPRPRHGARHGAGVPRHPALQRTPVPVPETYAWCADDRCWGHRST